MSAGSSLEAGTSRFSGFAGLYDDVRPLPPRELGDLLSSYCGRRPELVVDLGCGTGLSSRWASAWAQEVVGVGAGRLPSPQPRRGTLDASPT
ncbi:MAG: hypothetical protein ACYDH5_05485 [Acidimicrobiales bacterium]